MKHIWIVVIGIALIAFGQLAEQLMPMIGRVAYQAAAAGSYSPSKYDLNLLGYNLMCALVIVIGVVAVVVERKRA